MIKLWKHHNREKSKSQAIVEFAIIIPLLLLLLTAIIEFGYAFFTWASVGETARIATRYAVTGQFDPKYCEQAALFLDAQLTAASKPTHYLRDDLQDYPSFDSSQIGNTSYILSLSSHADCQVPTYFKDSTTNKIPDYDVTAAALQDWARLPSIRDAGMNGGSTGMLFDQSVSGNYINFISNPATAFNQNYRGDPTARGFIAINICSNRATLDTTNNHVIGFATDGNKHYYNNLTTDTNALFLGVCVKTDTDPNNPNFPSIVSFSDDPGGPGDRIRITVTYNHPLIIPFFSAIWNFLKISTTQDAIVEKFRTSRLAGLAGGISQIATWTLVPTSTSTSTITLTPTTTLTPTLTLTPTITLTFTPTRTFTPTSTFTPAPIACSGPFTGTGLRGNYYQNGSTANDDAQRFLGAPFYTHTDGPINFLSFSFTGGHDATYFQARWEGWISPAFPANYTFHVTSDDGIRMWIGDAANGDVIPTVVPYPLPGGYDTGILQTNSWSTHPNTTYDASSIFLSCGLHPIRIDFFQHTGGAVAQLEWEIPNFPLATRTIVPISNLYPMQGTTPLATNTYTPTVTQTRTVTQTPTITQTFTITPTFTQTSTPTKTFTVTPTFTPTDTPVATQTPTVTQTGTKTQTPTPSRTPTITPTGTVTPTPCPSDTGCN